jgi:isocitrate dehydrogenase
MVEYLGEKHISDAIFKATEQTIDEGKFLTYDLGGSASLSKMAEEIAQRSASLMRK